MRYRHTPKHTRSYIGPTLLILLALFIIAFFQDIWQIFRAALVLGIRFIGYNVPYPAGVGHSILIVLFNLGLGFILVAFLWAVLVSGQALLPIRRYRHYGPVRSSNNHNGNGNGNHGNGNGQGRSPPGAVDMAWPGAGEILYSSRESQPPQANSPSEHSNALELARTSWHFALHILHIHGPAVFIEGGKIRGSNEELNLPFPGVAVIDFNSAIVLDERMPSPGLLDPLWRLSMAILVPLGLSDPRVPCRAVGPGLVYIRRAEKIRGAVDLRRQFRIRTDVSAYTRDGIELKTNPWVIFTIGQDPEVVDVTYTSERGDPRRPRDIRIVNLERLSGGRVRVKSFSDELDDDDIQEIHHYYRVDSRHRQFQLFKPVPASNTLPSYDPDRVFAALYSRARDDAHEALIPWDQLPTTFATDIVRDLLHDINYDQLYELNPASDNINYVLYKGKLRRRMRNNGILSYRTIIHRRGEPLEVGREYRESELWASPVRPLTTPKILRNRGIKVIASGFSEPVPLNEHVYEKRLERWEAPWHRDTEINRAHQELEAMRIRTRARIQAQQDFIYSLAQILQSHEHSEEVAAVRVLQALETAADDPNTRQLLPRHIIVMMRTLHDWLLPEEASPPAQGFDDQL